jgi:hypothetical protein
MDIKIFWTVFIAASLVHAINASIVFTVMHIRKARHAKWEKELQEMYLRAVEYMNAGNQEAAEMMATRYRERSGRAMPPVIMVEREMEDGP